VLSVHGRIHTYDDDDGDLFHGQRRCCWLGLLASASVSAPLRSTLQVHTVGQRTTTPTPKHPSTSALVHERPRVPQTGTTHCACTPNERRADMYLVLIEHHPLCAKEHTFRMWFVGAGSWAWFSDSCSSHKANMFGLDSSRRQGWWPWRALISAAGLLVLTQLGCDAKACQHLRHCACPGGRLPSSPAQKMVCARAGQGLGFRSLRGGLDGEADEENSGRDYSSYPSGVSSETSSRDCSCCERGADAMVMKRKIKKKF
jgi:hypothetical protein